MKKQNNYSKEQIELIKYHKKLNKRYKKRTEDEQKQKLQAKICDDTTTHS